MYYSFRHWKNYEYNFFYDYVNNLNLSRIKNTTNEGVANSWKKGKRAKTRNGNMTTDGKNIFSYGLLIGFTDSRNKKIGVYSRGITQSTTRHYSWLPMSREITRDRFSTLQKRNRYVDNSKIKHNLEELTENQIMKKNLMEMFN